MKKLTKTHHKLWIKKGLTLYSKKDLFHFAKLTFMLLVTKEILEEIKND